MIRRLLFVLFLTGSVFSCKLPTGDAANSSGTGVTRAYIDEKYPHWQVTVERLEVVAGAKEITREDKIYLLKAFAVLRWIINMPEFERDTLQDSWLEPFYPWINPPQDCPLSEYIVTKRNEKLNRARVLETIRKSKYSVIVQRMAHTDQTWYADLGPFSYTYLGYKDFLYGRRLYLNNLPWDDRNFGSKKYFMEALFHEHMHLVGYGHDLSWTEGGAGGVPYYGSYILRRIYEKIQDTHPVELQELEEYYLSFLDKLNVVEVKSTARTAGIVSCSYNH